MNANAVNLASKTKKIMDSIMKQIENDKELNPITTYALLRLLALGFDFMADNAGTNKTEEKK